MENPTNELAMFIRARATDDEDGTATTVLGERLLVDGEIKRRFVTHVE